MSNKHYNAKQLDEMGYNLKVPIRERGILSSNHYLKFFATNNPEEPVQSIKNIALKKYGEDYFEIANSISHRPLNKENLALMYTVDYGNNRQEILSLSEIESIFLKDDTSDREFWNKLSDLNKSF